MNQNIDAFFCEIIELVPKGKQSSFHLMSIRNFISQIDNIGDTRLRVEAEKRISLYLAKVKELIADSDNNCDSLDLFNEYVYPIAKIYEDSLRFSVRIKWWIFVGWVIMGNGLIFCIYSSKAMYIIYNLIIGLYFLRAIIFEIKGKVYSYYY